MPPCGLPQKTKLPLPSALRKFLRGKSQVQSRASPFVVTFPGNGWERGTDCAAGYGVLPTVILVEVCPILESRASDLVARQRREPSR